MDNNNLPKNPFKTHICEKCNYRTCNFKDYKKHLSTAKHKRITMDNELSPKIPKLYICQCGSEYKYSSGLSKHKKKCEYKPVSHEEAENATEKIKSTSEPIVEFLLKENLEMKKMMIDLCQKIEPVSNTNINSHNKIFNINLFLNEDCKDAMNMTEFIESIQLSIEDVKQIGMEGQTQALSNILSSKLNEMDIFKRPLHCSDAKKEIIYVKDQDKWEKEAKTNPQLKKALDKITKESLCKLPEFQSDPDEYIKTVSEVLKEPREDGKIISDVAKEMLVK